jgi:proteasome accessory factor B
MDRLERLVNLLSALIETTRPLTRDEIRNRVPGYASEDQAFRRAFERDKETLRGMGVALVTEPLDPDYPDHGDGYRVPPEKYSLPDPGLTREEMDALALAASAVKLKGDAAIDALWKLGGNAERRSSTTVDLADDDRLTQLFAARGEHRTISFVHKGKNRTVDPYRLSFRNGHWYVNGFDHDHQDARTFRIDRIEGQIEVSEPNAFDTPAPVNQPWLQAWEMGDEPPVTARVLIDATQADLATQQAGKETIVETRDDGSVVLELTVTNNEGLRSFVLGFLDHAELIEPEQMRAEFVTYLKRLAVA